LFDWSILRFLRFYHPPFGLHRLTFEGYQKICADHPHIALKLVANIALVISQRLRVRSQEVRMLADR
jgi:hypothetical protein